MAEMIGPDADKPDPDNEEWRCNKYAVVAWTFEDVLTLRPAWTQEQAEDFLSLNESRITDRLVELGWDVIGGLLPLKTQADIDAESEE